jgi:polar amino acid transport system substrate-binding protein
MKRAQTSNLGQRLRTHWAAAPAAIMAVALAAAGCGGKGSESTKAGAASVTPPSRIAKAGKLVFCSDVSYPPEEFFTGSTPTGSDIDIGKAVAGQMGVKATFSNTGFDGIIPALQAKKCDAIISAMNDTPQRRRQVAFTDYLSAGQSIMVAHGNPKRIRSLPDLAGRSVSVETGTTNRDFLRRESKRLQALGKKPIHIVTFPKDTDAVAALKTGKVDAYFGDSPPVSYYIKQDPAAFAFGGAPIHPLPIGIATRKDDVALQKAMRRAVNSTERRGIVARILKKWRLAATPMRA